MRCFRRRIRLPWRYLRGAAVFAALIVAAPALPGHGGEIDAETTIHLLKGRRDYRTHCAPCHGLDGTATLSYAPDLLAGVAGLNDEYFLGIMETGGFMMPPWGVVVTQEARVDIVTFVRHLAGGTLARQPCEHLSFGADRRRRPATPLPLLSRLRRTPGELLERRRGAAE